MILHIKNNIKEKQSQHDNPKLLSGSVHFAILFFIFVQNIDAHHFYLVEVVQSHHSDGRITSFYFLLFLELINQYLHWSKNKHKFSEKYFYMMAREVFIKVYLYCVFIYLFIFKKCLALYFLKNTLCFFFYFKM